MNSNHKPYEWKTVSFACALLATAAVLIWQGAVARFDYGGNWTAFFRTGSRIALPATTAQCRLYVFANSGGYDGEFYHLMAHDPFIAHGTGRSIDAPRLRYRRILMPALAWALALGDGGRIDAAYIAVVALFIFAGTWWLSRYAVLLGRNPWWGSAFIAVPGVFISVDRLTVDLALCALTAGFVLYLRTGPDWKVYAVLACAPLARETGFLLVAACCLKSVFQKNWRNVAAFAAAALPGAAWWIFVQRHTAGYATEWLNLPFRGALETVFHPGRYPARLWYITPFEYLAWGGLFLAIGIALARWKKDPPLTFAAALFAVLAVLVNYTVWEEPEAFGRVFAPLLMLLPLSRPSPGMLIPMLAIIPRAATYPASESLSVLRAVFRA